MPREKTCEFCGKTFVLKRNYGQRFCSHSCHYAWQRSNRVTVVCPVCGTEFTKVKTSEQKFCSKRCYAKFINERDKTKICPICGISFIPHNHGKRSCCSRQCNALYQELYGEDRNDNRRLCGECKKWQADEKRTNGIRFGICKEMGKRTDRCRVCELVNE